MSWLYATIGAAVIWAVLGVIAKELMDHSSGLVYTFLYSALAFLFYTPLFIYFYPRTELELFPLVIGVFLVSGVANVFGFMAYNYSIKYGELSRVIPFTKLNPVFTAVLGVLILGEAMTYMKGGGIVLVTLGSYVILEEKDASIREPIRRFRELEAPKLAVASAFIFSIAAIADRYATQRISPKLYTYFLYVFLTGTLGGYILARRKDLVSTVKTELRENLELYAFTGVGAATASYLIFYAFSNAAASKVIPVLQIQVLLSIIFGFEFFNEGNLSRKILGSAVLVAGVVMVAL
ncbi:MAG: EamA family transporter [Candidatus Nanohaloarchaea archaeon]